MYPPWLEKNFPFRLVYLQVEKLNLENFNKNPSTTVPQVFPSHLISPQTVRNWLFPRQQLLYKQFPIYNYLEIIVL